MNTISCNHNLHLGSPLPKIPRDKFFPKITIRGEQVSNDLFSLISNQVPLIPKIGELPKEKNKVSTSTFSLSPPLPQQKNALKMS